MKEFEKDFVKKIVRKQLGVGKNLSVEIVKSIFEKVD